MPQPPKTPPPFPVYRRFPDELSAATSPSLRRIVRKRVSQPEFVAASKEFKRALKTAREKSRKQCVARLQESR